MVSAPNPESFQRGVRKIIDPQGLARLDHKIEAGKVVLFLGAGASMGAGGPDGRLLIENIERKFGIPASNSNDMLEICKLVLDLPGVDRRDLEKLVNEQLGRLQPTGAHYALCRHRWSAVYTTNFDDLLELTYRTATDPVQSHCDVIHAKRSIFSWSTDSVLPVFKLMGTIHQTDPESQPVLSRRDFNRRLIAQRELLNSLTDFVRDGTFIYLGYSFEDEIALTMLDFVQESSGAERLPWGYVISPSVSSRVAALLPKYKLIHLPWRFDEFAEHLNGLSSALQQPGSKPKGILRVQLKDCAISLDLSDPEVLGLTRQFEVVHEATGDNSKSKDALEQQILNFYEAKGDIWYGIKNRWAFQRAECKRLLETLRKLLSKEQPHPSRPVVLLTGAAGAGKSVTARIAALRIYSETGVPVIFSRPRLARFDPRALEALCRRLVKMQVAALADAVEIDPLVPLLVFDDAAINIDAISSLPSLLEARGIRAVILIVARKNEWLYANRQSNGQGKPKVVPIEELKMPDQLENDDEAARLVAHLNHQETTNNVRLNRETRRVLRTAGRMFWDAIFRLVYPARLPLLEAVRSEYDQLEPLAKSAYRLTCVTFQFGIEMPIGLLTRTLGCSYDKFIQSAFDPVARGVLLQTDDSVEFFRARSRLIAEAVIDHAYKDADVSLKSSREQSDLRLLVSRTVASNVVEVSLLQRLLIKTLGPNGDRPLDPLRLDELFEAAFSNGVDDSSLLLHHAISLSDRGAFDVALRYAKRSLKVVDSSDAMTHLQSESRTNILHHMGMIYARWALKAQGLGATEADELFAEAEESFRAARTSSRFNSYPYYSAAWLYCERARKSTGTQALRLICSGFRLVDEGIANLPESETKGWDIEGKLVAALSDALATTAELDALCEHEPDDYGYLYARLAIMGIDSKYSKEGAVNLLMQSLDTSELPHASTVGLLLRLVEDLPTQFSILELWYSKTRSRDAHLLFKFAVLCFAMRQFGRGFILFDELGDLAPDHPYRSGNRDSSPIEFAGVVAPGLTRSDGWIVCDSIGRKTRFFPLAANYTFSSGQAVRFRLNFNFRGPLAIPQPV